MRTARHMTSYVVGRTVGTGFVLMWLAAMSIAAASATSRTNRVTR